MRIPLENIKDTSITEDEVYALLSFYLYVNNLNSLLAIRLFSSSHSCSRHFKEYDSLKSILHCCQVFGGTAAKLMLYHWIFYIPCSVLNPALRLNLNALNEEDCQKYFRFGHSDIKKYWCNYRCRRWLSHQITRIACLLWKLYALYYIVYHIHATGLIYRIILAGM